VQSADSVVVELRCLLAELHLVFILDLTVDGDLSVLHCQLFFVDLDLLIRDAYLVVVEAIFVDSYQVRELRLDNHPVGVLALLEFIS
jgi:hypothetical protein